MCVFLYNIFWIVFHFAKYFQKQTQNSDQGVNFEYWFQFNWILYNSMDVNLKRVDVNLRTHLFLKFENEYHVNLSSHVIQKKDE